MHISAKRSTFTKRSISLLAAVLLCAGLLLPAAAYTWNPFDDISPSAWYYEDVMNAVDSGLINGKTGSTFCPDDYLTYAEAVKLAACMNQLWWTGWVSLKNGSPWYQTYVDYAWETGIISDWYDWNGYATRGRFLTLFANALPSSAMTEINYIPDDSIPDVSVWDPDADAVYLLYRAGIVQGSDSAHSCRPYDYIKRSEVAAILTRMMDPYERLYFTTSWDSSSREDDDWGYGYDGYEYEETGPRKYWIVVDFFDRDDLTVYTEATTLGMLLYENGITLSDDEVPSVDLWDDWLAEDMTVTVDRYFTAYEDVLQIVPYTEEEIGVDTIPRGDINLLEEGVNGESIMHYTVTYKNGMEIDRRVDWEEVLIDMVPSRYEIGIGGTLIGGDGDIYSYSWRKTCKATYYNIYGNTYSGNYVSTHTVATNFDYIPLGTRMYIKNDRYDFGYRVSEDTGHLDPWQVDIWMPDDDPNAPLMSVEGVVYDMEVFFLD